MVKHVELVLHSLKDTCSFSDAAELAEQTDKFGLEKVLVVETVFDDKGQDLVKLFEGSAEF